MKRTFHYASVAKQITKEEYKEILLTADVIVPINTTEHKKKFPFCTLNGDKYEVIKDGKHSILVHIEDWRGKEQWGIRESVTEIEIEN